MGDAGSESFFTQGQASDEVFLGDDLQGLTSIDVGGQSVKFVESFLASERIPIVSRDVLSNCARKVCLFPRSGKAMVKRLASTNNANVAAQERAAAQRATPAASAGGSIDLF